MTFWFGDPTVENVSYSARRKLWFRKDEAVDQEIRDRFMGLYERARTGQLDHWRATREGRLALILVCDQFPRNMFRGSAQAFATDAFARERAIEAIALKDDDAHPPERQVFLYLPLEHSENLDDQNRSVALFRALAEANPDLADTYDYALKHRDVIARFGRFPHRNEVLGRVSTPEEIEFLKQPGSSF